jgi:hypothetical protein
VPELAAKLPPRERVYAALIERGDATPEELAEDVGITPGTVRNHLTALRGAGRADSTAGHWRPVIHDSRPLYRTVNRETPRNGVNPDSFECGDCGSGDPAYDENGRLFCPACGSERALAM